MKNPRNQNNLKNHNNNNRKIKTKDNQILLKLMLQIAVKGSLLKINLIRIVPIQI